MGHLRNLLVATRAIACAELGLFRRFPRQIAAMVAIVLVPAVYSLIYLASVWDPVSHTSELPAAIVNLDTGAVYQEQQANVGKELTKSLLEKHAFGFRLMPDAEAARKAVRDGSLAFALIIPADFSATAIPGTKPGAGQLVVYTSEGNNYTSAAFARHFATELGHQTNETLNEQRWALVLATASGSRQRLDRLRQGLAELKAGAQTLAQGSKQYSEAARQLSTGFKQVGDGIRTLDARLPSESDLAALKTGSQQLISGQRELGKGLEQLDGGAGKLAAGARDMEAQAEDIPFVGGRVSKGAADLADGAEQLGAGLNRAREANAQLVSGAGSLQTGVGKLTDGVTALGGGLHTMASRLPDNARLDSFAQGGQALSQGAAKLQTGVQIIHSAVPGSITSPDGSARGLAQSVEPRLEIVAPVANNGSAFIPSMVSVALWIGAVMMAYLFNLHLLPDTQSDAPRLAKALGKFSMPALMVLLQACLTMAALIGLLDVRVLELLALAVTMSLASLTFLAIVFALQRVFGEAGKLLAMLLLTLQLSAGGGLLPIELSGSFFRMVHDWLPFTWVVQAFRASLFGAYDNNWMQAWLVVVLAGVAAMTVVTLAGPWKIVPHKDYVPAIEI